MHGAGGVGFDTRARMKSRCCSRPLGRGDVLEHYQHQHGQVHGHGDRGESSEQRGWLEQHLTAHQVRLHAAAGARAVVGLQLRMHLLACRYSKANLRRRASSLVPFSKRDRFGARGVFVWLEGSAACTCTQSQGAHYMRIKRRALG